MEQRREGKQTREEKGGKTGSEERRERERERERREKKKEGIFPVFRRSEFSSPRSKIGLLDEIYE